MAEPGDVVIQRDNQPVEPVGQFLQPLNNVMVQLDFDSNKYEYLKENFPGAEIMPVQCGSSRAAAYRFQPEQIFTPLEQEVTVLRGSRRDESGQRTGGESEKVMLNPEQLLTGASKRQCIPYWRGCDKEETLTEHYQPDEIVDITVPADLTEDRLGFFARARIVSETYQDVMHRLLDINKSLQNPKLMVAFSQEEERLKAALKKVRQQIDNNLAAEQIQLTVPGADGIPIQKNYSITDSEEQINGGMANASDEDARLRLGELLDKKSKLMRVQQRLRNM